MVVGSGVVDVVVEVVVGTGVVVVGAGVVVLVVVEVEVLVLVVVELVVVDVVVVPVVADVPVVDVPVVLVVVVIGAGVVVDVVVDVVVEVVVPVVPVVDVVVVVDVVDVVVLVVAGGTQVAPWQVPVPPPVRVQGAPGVTELTQTPPVQATAWQRAGAGQSAVDWHWQVRRPAAPLAQRREQQSAFSRQSRPGSRHAAAPALCAPARPRMPATRPARTPRRVPESANDFVSASKREPSTMLLRGRRGDGS